MDLLAHNDPINRVDLRSRGEHLRVSYCSIAKEIVKKNCYKRPVRYAAVLNDTRRRNASGGSVCRWIDRTESGMEERIK